jgi:hypothetical protein
MDHGWRAKEDGDRMKKAIPQIYQTGRFYRITQTKDLSTWTGFVSRRHNHVIPEPFRRGSITSRERTYNALALQVEAAIVPYVRLVFG